MFCPDRCLIVVFSGSCLPLLSSCWERGSWLRSFSLICDLCNVCLALFALLLGVIARLLMGKAHKLVLVVLEERHLVA